MDGSASLQKIPAKQAEAEIKERGSRFIALLFPVHSREEAEQKLAEVQKEYADASHVCYVWRIHTGSEIQEMASDDGEPAHSAGTPILNALKSREVVQALAVVVRYFGGTKLGVRGLIEAYGGTAALSLKRAGIKEVLPSKRYTLDFPYSATAQVKALLHACSAEVVDEDYGAACHYKIRLPLDSEDEFEEKSREVRKLNIKALEKGGL